MSLSRRQLYTPQAFPENKNNPVPIRVIRGKKTPGGLRP
jgi:hypothetical protein